MSSEKEEILYYVDAKGEPQQLTYVPKQSSIFEGGSAPSSPEVPEPESKETTMEEETRAYHNLQRALYVGYGGYASRNRKVSTPPRGQTEYRTKVQGEAQTYYSQKERHYKGKSRNKQPFVLTERYKSTRQPACIACIECVKANKRLHAVPEYPFDHKKHYWYVSDK